MQTAITQSIETYKLNDTQQLNLPEELLNKIRENRARKLAQQIPL